MQGLLKGKLNEIEKLCQEYDVKTLYVFGNRKIDLLTENSLSNPYLIESIEETKQLLYAA
jgi:uncharacterized protein